MIRRKTRVSVLMALPVILALAGDLSGSTGGAAAAEPDAIYHNGLLLTMDAVRPEAEALAVAGDRIVAVGSDAEILSLAGPGTEVIDLGGRIMLPGFIDTHTHRIAQRYKWGYESVGDAAEAALAQGWTTLNELAVGEGELAELLEAAAQGQLPIRVNAYLTVNTFDGNPLGGWYSAYAPGQVLGPTLRIAGLKLFIDLNSGRVLFFSEEELTGLLQSPELAGWQVAIKAIGIQSHELALSAIEAALQGEPNDLHRYRLEHSLAVTDEQLARLVDLGIIAAIQPSFPGVVWHEADIRALTEEQGQANIFRWSDYLEAGVFMVASPYNPDGVNEQLTSPTHVSPMGLIFRSVTQIGLDNSRPEPWMLNKAIGVADILPMLTIDAAYASFEEADKGSLTPGKLADLVVLSGNPLAVPAGGLLGIEVLLTVVGGEAVHCAEGEGALCPGR
jgi:hypothetical protein